MISCPIFDLIVLIEANDSFSTLENDLVGLRNNLVKGSTPEEMIDPLKGLAKTEALYVAACTSGHRDISLHF